jgi:glucose/arabinose dehydrogenase
MRWLSVALVSSALVSCGGSSPPSPPVVNPPASNETIKGTERIGWDQPAADAVELATIRYAIYVDDVRSELTGVSCASSAATNGFACTARLPALTAGAHTLQLASFINDGSIREGVRSAPLRVIVVPAVAPASTSAPTIRPGTIRTSDGAGARVELVADGLDAPTDLAFAPDGRLFVTERRGRIRVVRGGRLLAEPAISLDTILGADCQLLALAIDPQFARTHFVYGIYTAPARSGDRRFSIARLREASDTLGDPVVVLDGVPASAPPAAALRFGPDGKLYAALDAGGDARRSADASSLNGKVLRLNADGTTPADQGGATPIFAGGLTSPVGMAWHPASGALWVADRGAGGPAQLRTIATQPSAASAARDKRGIAGAAYALPADAAPSALVFGGVDGVPAMANSLIVASEGGAHLLRLRFDPQTARPAGTERLLQDVVDGVRAIAIAPDGAIYFATSNSLGRIVRDTR